MSNPSRIGGSLAVVLPRYGKGLGGGAETLVGALVDRLLGVAEGGQLLPEGPLIERLEVWSTCAKDHRTWENHYPPGKTIEDEVVVRRFAVDQRDLETFISCELSIQQGRALSIDEQLDWLENSVNSSDLYRHIACHGQEFDALLFAPYLFATSFWGALIYPERSILIPCLHDEAYAYQDVFLHLFSSVRGLLFNAHPEQELAERIYSGIASEQKGFVVGMGFDDISSDKRSLATAPYLLYSGRKESGKNLDFLIECFSKYREANPSSALELRIIGSGKIEFIDTLPDGVVDLGFVAESEKKQLMAGALCLCQPSVNESFSIVMMEAWLHQTPVLVHSECAVTKAHLTSAQGGLYFGNAEEFSGSVQRLLNDASMCKTMGNLGYRYVREKYCWDAVLSRFFNALEALEIGTEQPSESAKRRQAY